MTWVARHVHLLRCDACGGRWVAARSTRVVFHQCTAERPRGQWWSPPNSDLEREAWARHLLGADLIASLEAREGTPGDHRLTQHDPQ